jgi:hypothetical protein
MKTFLPGIIICFILFIGCKKETEKRHCWQLIDNVGNDLNAVCDKTEAELLYCVKNNTCGTYFNGGSITSCNYYQTDGDRFCWKINNSYFRDITESQANLYARCFYGNAIPAKVDCSFACQRWYHREKKTYKPTSSITYSFVTLENFCGDTVATLYQGRQIIRKDDADSLIVTQFSNNGINW